MSIESDPTALFESHRRRLFNIAYRMLGSATEAEDAVQDVYPRWHRSRPQLLVSPEAWLTRVLVNGCLNRLASARSTRERYVGPWLPEPVLTDSAPLGPLETVEQRESVSTAMLVLLERLTPRERAAVILREAFQYPHRDIANILGVSESLSQQLCLRARRRLADGTTRFEPGDGHRRRLTREFLAAASTGDTSGLRTLLTDDVVAWADGGGKASAARRPIVGVDKVVRYLTGWLSRIEEAPTEYSPLTLLSAEVNGAPAVIGRTPEAVFGVMVFHRRGTRVDLLHVIANPDKLQFITRQLPTAATAVLYDEPR